MTWVVRTREDFNWGMLDLRIGYKRFDNTYLVVQPLTLKTYNVGEYIEEVTIKAGCEYDARDFLQACVDHAAELGIFPTNKTKVEKEIAAVRYHLEDMRKLVFK